MKKPSCQWEWDWLFAWWFYRYDFIYRLRFYSLHFVQYYFVRVPFCPCYFVLEPIMAVTD